MMLRSGSFKWAGHVHINQHKILLILFTIVLSLRFGETSLPRDFNLSREHVGVKFEPPSTIEQKYRYKKENLQVIIPLIARKFGTIAIRGAPTLPKGTSLEALNDSLLLIPILVAEHNRNHPQIFTECIMAFYEKPGNTAGAKTDMSSMETAKYVADFANAIYPGTVKTIARQGEWILDWDDISNKLQETSKFLNPSSGNVSKTRYKLAVIMENFDCKKIHAVLLHSSEFTSNTLEYADAVVPHIWDTTKTDKLNPHERHNVLVAQFDECEKSLTKLKPKRLEVIPRVTCSMPKNRDFLEISMFLQCWQLMSNWAKENNRTVLMDHPFEYFQSSPGWWRMTTENVKWVNESSFHERAIEDVPCLEVGGETAAYFDHRVRYQQHKSFYSENEIETMFQLVSSRFSTIFVTSNATYFKSTESRRTTWVAEAVAKFNKGTTNNPSIKTLKVFLTFCSNNQTTESQQDTKNNGCANFQSSLKAAQSANEIHPDTVYSIVYEKFEGPPENVADAMKTLANEMDLQKESIQIGAILDMTTCEFVRNGFQLLSEWINGLIIDITGSIDSYSMDQHPDSSLRKLISNWTDCRESFAAEFPDVEFQLAVDCSKVVKPMSYSSESIVRCWQIVSEWGLKNQIKVILLRAFDKHKDYLDDKVGWWRLRSKSEVDIKLSSFVEVTEDVEWDNSIYCSHLANPTMATPIQVDCERNNMSISIILPILCLVLILTAQGALFVYLHGCNWKYLRRHVLNDSHELHIVEN